MSEQSDDSEVSTLFNPATGVRVTVPETVDHELRSAICPPPADGDSPDIVEISLSPGARGPVEHLHPDTEERFVVVDGEVTFRIDGRERSLSRGRSVRVSPGTAHAFRNDGDHATRLYGRTVPESERLGEIVATLFGLAVVGRTDDRGLPGPLQGAAIAEYTDATRIAGVPLTVQRLYGRTVGPVARALGYEATYDRYLEPSFWREATWAWDRD